MNPQVTVFIPTFNCEKYITDCLESILHQTYKEIEILVVDDGSTDRTVEIIESYEDSRIVLIKNEINRGIPYTRNLGLENARGKYMVIMDSDDISELDRIKVQVEFMEKNNHILATGTYYKTFGNRINRIFKNPTDDESIRINLMFGSPISNPSSIVRLDKIKEHNIKYNLECFVAQDYDFWVQLAKIGKLANIPEILLNYRIGHGNITERTSSEKIFERKKITDTIREDALNHLGFNLSRNEMESFNSFFGDNIQNTLNPEEINSKWFDEMKNLLDKLFEINKAKGIFTSNKFENIVEKFVYTRIAMIQTGLFNKIKISRKIFARIKIKEALFFYSYFALRNIYQKIK